MIETIEAITVQSENVTLSLLIWRRFKRSMPGLVERTLDYNPGLSDVGAFLPVGMTVQVPIPAQREPIDITPVRLW